MEPAHFLASGSAREGRSPEEIDAFYDLHGWESFAFIHRLRAWMAVLRRDTSRPGEFAVAYPAE